MTDTLLKQIIQQVARLERQVDDIVKPEIIADAVGGTGITPHVTYWTGVKTLGAPLADNVATALTIQDGGALEYLRVVSTNAQPQIYLDPGDPALNTEIIIGGTAHGSNDPVMVIVRSITGAAGTNAHAYVDESTINRDGVIGYNSFDADATVTGTYDYDHVVGFQARPNFNSSGAIDRLMGFTSLLDVTQGTVTNVIHYRCKDFDLIGGAATHQYAYYIHDTLASATNNWGFYDNGSNDHVFGQRIFINETSNVNMSIGLTIDQGANDDEILNLRSSDVGAVYNVVETNTFATCNKADNNAGGLALDAYRDADGGNYAALQARGFLAENPDTAKTTAARAIVELGGFQTDGTNLANTVADGNVLAMRTRRGGSSVTLFVIDEGADAILPSGRIATGYADWWDIEDYHAGAPTADGYVLVDINGVTYHLLAYTP